ncbi:MAG TPA: VCBS repeat-containing protein [Candidatus Binatia bacterium]|nr:VCBS repeat-containing protein [Candidatus Binatia bacterium]
MKARANAKTLRHANAPTGKPGFVSAIQIPAGGWTYWDAGKGDFNGDGKQDVATIVENYDSINQVYTYSLSVLLGNGNGTFKAPTLTAISDPCSVFAVGDVDRDKKDDIVIVHVGGYCSNTSSGFDVLISNGDGTFTPKNDTPYAISPNWLRGGTLAVTTKSGFLDVVAVDYPTDGSTPSSVVTVLGNGDGTFSTTPTSISLSRPVAESAIADLNGDGLLDIVGTDAASSRVTVFLATSATAYAGGVPYTTPDGGYGTNSIAIGDLNNDGKPEIVTPSWTGNISVYVNNGDGSFQPAVYYDAVWSGPDGAPGWTYPTAIAIADVNGDGNADVVSSNAYSSDVTILLGNGDGTLNVPTFGYAVGGGTYDDPRVAAIVADFDGDGFADIVVPDYGFSLAFLKGYNDGTFRAALNYYAPAANNEWVGAVGLANGDFNGDGIPDIVIGSEGGWNIAGITVFLTRPDGSLKPGVTYGTSNCYWYVAVADFDKDGHPDIAATNHCSGELEIFNGKANGTFVPGPAIATDVSNMTPSDLVVGDFDGDGYPDVAVINQNSEEGNSSVAVILNDGTGNFKPAVTYPLSTISYQGIAVGDLNGDKKLDIVVPYSYDASAVALLLGVGDGTFSQASDVAVGIPGVDPYCSTTGQLCPQMVTLADIDADGNTDIIATLRHGGGQDIVILPGTGTTEGVPSFGTPTYLASSLQQQGTGWPSPAGIQAIDIDGDGNLDLVYTNASYGTIGLLYGAGSGKFYDPVEYPAGGWPWLVAVADMNKDGAKDLVVADNTFSGVTVLLNAAGSGTTASYTVMVDSDTQTAKAGSSATFNFTMTPSNHYDGTIRFSCGGLPDKATCTFNPTSVVMDGHTPATVQLTIATTATTTTTAAMRNNSSIILATTLSGMGLFGMLFVGTLPKRRRVLGTMLGIVVLVMMISLVGCGGSSSKTPVTTTIPGTPAGTYAVTVTAKGTGGSYGGDTSDHPMAVTLTVQ